MSLFFNNIRCLLGKHDWYAISERTNPPKITGRVCINCCRVENE